jgi:hypothetical protein
MPHAWHWCHDIDYYYWQITPLLTLLLLILILILIIDIIDWCHWYWLLITLTLTLTLLIIDWHYFDIDIIDITPLIISLDITIPLAIDYAITPLIRWCHYAITLRHYIITLTLHYYFHIDAMLTLRHWWYWLLTFRISHIID